MPETKAIERARKDQKEGKASTTQAGEFVREEMHQAQEGKGNARSSKQAIAIGLSKARQAGVKIPAKKDGKNSGASSASKANGRGGSGSSTRSKSGSKAVAGGRKSSTAQSARTRQGMEGTRQQPRSKRRATTSKNGGRTRTAK